MKTRMTFIAGLVFSYLLIGLWVGSRLEADLNDLMFWFPLLFSCLGTYNVGAYFFGWTIFGGPGGTISPDRDKFDRVGGAIVSALVVCIFMYFWIDALPR